MYVFLKQYREWIRLLSSTKPIFRKKLIWQKVKELAGNGKLVTTSLLKDEGIDELEEAIAKTLFRRKY